MTLGADTYELDFSRPDLGPTELRYADQALQYGRIAGNGIFTQECEGLLRSSLPAQHVALSSSCTHALELAALLAGAKPGGEVIMPSFTFSSCANAFILFGAKPIFVDVRPDTMNIDEDLLESAITAKTQAILVMHYGGVACNMDRICDIAAQHQIPVIEDAAHAIYATYRGRALGTIGSIGTYSFHETKNLSCGEGGAIVVQDTDLFHRAEVLREKGTNRSAFFRGEIDKYSWIDLGSSYLMSDLSAAILTAQIERREEILAARQKVWDYYRSELFDLINKERIEVQAIPPECVHNAHIFYIKLADLAEREALREHLKQLGVHSVFHYVPLHSSIAGKKFGELRGEDQFTTTESSRLLRLPLFSAMNSEQMSRVVEGVYAFFVKR